ncbi:MAG TPA: hypothetical protein VIL96_00280 [Gaiellaceae bacterium]|jgi:hypothetical protein
MLRLRLVRHCRSYRDTSLFQILSPSDSTTWSTLRVNTPVTGSSVIGFGCDSPGVTGFAASASSLRTI